MPVTMSDYPRNYALAKHVDNIRFLNKMTITKQPNILAVGYS